MRRKCPNIYDLEEIHRRARELKEQRPKLVMRQDSLYDLSSRKLVLVERKRQPQGLYDLSRRRDDL